MRLRVILITFLGILANFSDHLTQLQIKVYVAIL